MSGFESRLTFDVVVEKPQAHHNKYAYDERHRAIRLEQVVYSRESAPVDWGIIPRTVGVDGAPLEALVLVSQPTFAGCLIDCRAIGAFEIRCGEHVWCRIVAVPTVDPYFADIGDVQALPPSRKEQVQSFFLQKEADDKAEFVWHTPQDAEKMVSEALRTARLLEKETKEQQGPPPAWKSSSFSPLVNPFASELWIRETDATTYVESSVRKLPFRFQNYIHQCLLPDERVLIWVYRPRTIASSAGWRLLARKQLNDGFLVVTDRQVLMIADALPPDATLVNWGYVARVAAVERLSRVEVVESSDGGRLDLRIDAVGGVETLPIEFPERCLPHVQEAADILRQFVPKENDRRLRRMPQDIVVELSGEERVGADSPPAALVEQIDAILSDGEEVLVQALIPANAEKKSGPKLVAVTAGRVLITGEPTISSSCGVYRISDISSIELRSFLLGCQFGLSVPGKAGVHRVKVDFEYPSVSQFVRVVRAVTQLLSSPVIKASSADSWTERLTRKIGLKRAV